VRVGGGKRNVDASVLPPVELDDLLVWDGRGDEPVLISFLQWKNNKIGGALVSDPNSAKEIKKTKVPIGTTNLTSLPLRLRIASMASTSRWS
jgi:hypothetical protein